jgi:hypothetical protein
LLANGIITDEVGFTEALREAVGDRPMPSGIYVMPRLVSNERLLDILLNR